MYCKVIHAGMYKQIKGMKELKGLYGDISAFPK